ncbi:MAG: sigma-70 family RNA polymerase sigma factor [Flavobacterium sp.]|nr:MAG: sigma-70 family RNA polymerase sigma factor [Flavobacterium sp.]
MGNDNLIAAQLHLAEAVKNNDELVLKQLYQECYGKIEVHILKNNGTRPQAKDTYQEAFIATWQNVKSGKFVPANETALQGYLYRIAKNKWTDYLRSSQFKKTSAMREGYEIPDEFDESNTDNIQQLNTAMEAFQKLGNECKQLLTYFYFEKKSMREIAMAFEIGEASARNKKYRCISKLRELAKTPIIKNE